MKCKYCKKGFADKPFRPYTDGFCSWDCLYAYNQRKMLQDIGVELPDGYIPPRDLPLSDRQEEFCELYIETRNYVKSFYRAFDSAQGKPIDEVRRKARVMLKLPFIKRRINEILKEYVEAIPENKPNIIENFAAVAHADMRSYFGEDGHVKPLHEWTQEMGIACKKVVRKYGKDGKIKEESVELYDKLRALTQLARIEQMYKETLEVNVNHTIASTIKQYGDNDIVAKLVNEEIKQVSETIDTELIEDEDDGSDD